MYVMAAAGATFLSNNVDGVCVCACVCRACVRERERQRGCVCERERVRLIMSVSISYIWRLIFTRRERKDVSGG